MLSSQSTTSCFVVPPIKSNKYYNNKYIWFASTFVCRLFVLKTAQLQYRYLTLPGDGVALEELLHHDFLAVTGNLDADTQSLSFKNTSVYVCVCFLCSDLQPCLSWCRLPSPAGPDPCRREWEEENQEPFIKTDGQVLYTGLVPVQWGDQSPGAALLLQQPANSCCLAALTCSKDDRLKQVHLQTHVSEPDNKKDWSDSVAVYKSISFMSGFTKAGTNKLPSAGHFFFF